MIPPASPVQVLLANNAKWADAVNRTEPGFFERSAQGQYPKVLWIGCADSRVPESVLTGARPGDVFVHRNIANQFHPDDDSAQAVLSYALGVVGVEHVVVAGHTQCGGVAACYQAALDRSATPNTVPTASAPPPSTHTPARSTAAEPKSECRSKSTSTPLARWLEPLTRLVASLDLESGLATTPRDTALDVIVRANVKRQVEHLCDSEPVREAWAKGKPVWVHGWLYDVATGRINDLGVSRGPGSEHQ